MWYDFQTEKLRSKVYVKVSVLLFIACFIQLFNIPCRIGAEHPNHIFKNLEFYKTKLLEPVFFVLVITQHFYFTLDLVYCNYMT